MNVWALSLYVIELLSLCGAISTRKQFNRVGNAIGTFAVFIAAFTFLAIYMLSQQSSAENAITLGWTYAATTAATLPWLFRDWSRGYMHPTTFRFVTTIVLTVVGLVIISMLAFAG